MSIGGWKDKVLFTPGPLTTSQTVKQALLRDLGSRDFSFIELVKDVRRRLLAVAGVQEDAFTAIPMQGSGTFSVEAVLSSTVRPDGKVLVVINGAYGERIKKMCAVLKIAHVALDFPENTAPDAAAVKQALADHPGITDVAIVHCETTTGIFNPIEEIGRVVHAAGARYFVDAMSSFGAVPVDFEAARIDYLVSSANKCIEGVPGFGFVIARKAALLETEGWARSLSLDLLAQWKGLEANGQFRFTPPTHVLLAFHQALLELDAEGGVAGRAARYQANYAIVVRGMEALGFKTYLRPDQRGYIITSFLYPEHPNWDFNRFYELLNDRDYVIYPGKVSNADCFRIGNIGRVFAADMHGLIAAVRDVVQEMGL
ncbi:MAG: 2-aminoethylphosphonate--pyruvate transaminase [Candidatus Hydrogenedentes bacterium]|nr:2-aminoethylphosphonate--pyruvate transaminase [Candidatus Hydrogenedentota bacterium]